MPEPFRSATAYLPFRLEAFIEAGQRRYIVSELSQDAPAVPGFGRGAEVTHWNGVPIARAVATNAEREAGSNSAARHAKGLSAMTIRWLGLSLPPDEDWVDVTFRPIGRRRARTRTARFEWRIFLQKSGAEHRVAEASATSIHLGMDARGEVERQVQNVLFGKPRRTGPASRVFGAGVLPSALPHVFPSSRSVVTPHGTFAYLRIATFNVVDDRPFLDEVIRLLGALPPDGLILDVRSNRGGLIHAGERLLQLLSPRPIEPCRFHFLNSERTEQITRRRGFTDWHPSVLQSVETGAEYSQGLPLLPMASYNDIGQRYQGPVVLITDALCQRLGIPADRPAAAPQRAPARQSVAESGGAAGDADRPGGGHPARGPRRRAGPHPRVHPRGRPAAQRGSDQPRRDAAGGLAQAAVDRGDRRAFEGPRRIGQRRLRGPVPAGAALWQPAHPAGVAGRLQHHRRPAPEPARQEPAARGLPQGNARRRRAADAAVT
jgi:hypothetical protein